VFLVVDDQIGVHFFDLLGNQSELRDALGINFRFVFKGDRLQREQHVARVVHVLNVLFEARGGGERAELAGGSDVDGHASGCSRVVDAGNECVGLRSADADDVGVAGNTGVAYVNIGAAGGNI
jgi:hypothetical protein